MVGMFLLFLLIWACLQRYYSVLLITDAKITSSAGRRMVLWSSRTDGAFHINASPSYTWCTVHRGPAEGVMILVAYCGCGALRQSAAYAARDGAGYQCLWFRTGSAFPERLYGQVPPLHLSSNASEQVHAFQTIIIYKIRIGLMAAHFLKRSPASFRFIWAMAICTYRWIDRRRLLHTWYFIAPYSCRTEVGISNLF